ncbi:HdeD family acid-resistance protein [Georgenia sp. TF02-10]|uniref:HdeD family acid-resistance protein n=1 Tax=Georgenia sp. TF02-10 TaxID=2917725 RepID=UPI001FA7CA64|nr:HdeD family acid-resistance protein [Georgenia sp. TF02-10]UNX54253.1 HdeD family acid-resistance protein [Georgenia sp. TF02-10]
MTLPPRDPLLESFAATSRRVWYLPVIRGVLAILLGVLALVWPAATLLTLILVLGVFWLVDGVVGIVDGVRWRGEAGAGLRIVLGVLGVLAGLVLVLQPGLSAGVLVTIAGVWAVLGGVALVVVSVQARRWGVGWGWGVAAGVVTAVFGILLIAWPGIGAATFVILLGAYALVAGIALVVHGLRIRALAKRLDRR